MVDVKKLLRRIWFVLWEDDSPLSILVSFVVAYLVIQYALYPGLGLVLGTHYPVVAVISGSMEHRAVSECVRYQQTAHGERCVEQSPLPVICGVELNASGHVTPSEYWHLCGSWYAQRGISQQAFDTFPFQNGFNTGDIMVLRSAKNVHLGDVIVFQSLTKEPIIHRVVGIKQTSRGTVYETKGDHNAGQIVEYTNQSVQGVTVRVPIIDETNVNAAQVVGKAWFKIPWLGYPKLWLSRLLSIL